MVYNEGIPLVNFYIQNQPLKEKAYVFFDQDIILGDHNNGTILEWLPYFLFDMSSTDVTNLHANHTIEFTFHSDDVPHLRYILNKMKCVEVSNAHEVYVTK